MAPWQFKKKQVKCMEGSPKCMECLKKCGAAGARKIKKSMRGNYDIFNCGCGFKCIESKDMKDCNDMRGGRKKMLTPVYMPTKGFIKSVRCVNNVCRTHTSHFDIPEDGTLARILGAVGTAGESPLLARLKNDFKSTKRHTRKQTSSKRKSKSKSKRKTYKKRSRASKRK